MMTATLTGGYMVKNNFFISVFAVFTFLVLGVSGVDTVMEGDSVTLYTGVKMNPEDRIRWYFKDIRIAYITGDQSQICTGDQCKEIFRDRLKLDHQTGSLTITNTRTEDSGEYQLMINSNSEKIFSVSVIGESLMNVLKQVMCV